MQDLVNLMFFLFGVMVALRLLAMIKVGNNKAARAVNPNMSEPCPPHAWGPPPEALKGQGIVYLCAKCKQSYPSQ